VNLRQQSAFTLIELVVVLALVAVLMTLVVIRFDLASDRQALISAARKLGNLIQTYRERAVLEDRTYALSINKAESSVSIYLITERRPGSLLQSKALSTMKLNRGVKISNVFVNGVAQEYSTVEVYLDGRGILGASEFRLESPQGTMLVVRPDPIANEINYSDP
jgi:prepilin-type N-terminal cleavage/methylation domain-containing protein